MRSPFPGMDPYLEDPAFWPDFHSSFVLYLRDALLDQLPDSYEARIDETLRVVELDPTEISHIKPDLALTRHEGEGLAPSRAASSAVATLEPVTVPLRQVEKVRERRIEILHRPERSLVTVLQLLSPIEKAERSRDAYLFKRLAVLQKPLHLIELDLLLGGARLPMGRPLPPGDYYALVSRDERRPYSEVYAWTIRQPLPTIPVPLRAPDPDIPLNLAAVFATAYERGRYRRSLAYQSPPPVKLREEDISWAAKQIG